MKPPSDQHSSNRSHHHQPKPSRSATHIEVGARPAPSFNTLREGFVFFGKSGRRYAVAAKLGEGGMGAVYKADEVGDDNDPDKRTTTTTTARSYAIKCEKFNPQRLLRRKGLRLAMEKLIMKTCKVSAHVPDYVDAGRTVEFGWIAMELVGPSLGTLRRCVPGQTFSTITVLRVGIQVIKGLRDIHDKGFVHRDLKPDNLAIGRGDKAAKIFVLDLGIARQFKNVAGVPHRPRLQIKFKGTRHFAPLALQVHEEYGPKDDLESLLYILAFFHVGWLPWSSERDDRAIVHSKKQCRDKPETIFGNDHQLGELLGLLWRYVVAKKYEDMLDYGYLVDLLTTALKPLAGPNGEHLVFDWERHGGKEGGSLATAKGSTVPRTAAAAATPRPSTSAPIPPPTSPAKKA